MLTQCQHQEQKAEFQVWPLSSLCFLEGRIYSSLAAGLYKNQFWHQILFFFVFMEVLDKAQ